MQIIERPTLVEEPVSDFRSRFIIKPLEPGFGHTLGNVLRRVLLSSIPGAAVTRIKIEGNQHEFSTLEGVVEDVTEIILNIKGLVLSSEVDEPVTMRLAKAEAGEVTAADIEAPAGVVVHNPDLHIATLNDQGKIDMELVVERGRGYISANTENLRDHEIGVIPVDSIYSPVVNVIPKVEATRFEQNTDFDKLILDVETKPSIFPRDAVASAAKTLLELFGLVAELNVDAEFNELPPADDEEQLNKDLALPVEQLDLSMRSYNCLKREGINTVGELVSRSEQDLMCIRNFGQKSIDEVKQRLESMGLSMKDSGLGSDLLAALTSFPFGETFRPDAEN